MKMKKVVYPMVFLFVSMALPGACASTTGRTAGAMVDDTTMANTIRAKITEDKELAILKINTDLFNGNVTLLGVVPNKVSESRLVALVQSVKGAHSILLERFFRFYPNGLPALLPRPPLLYRSVRPTSILNASFSSILLSV